MSLNLFKEFLIGNFLKNQVLIISVTPFLFLVKRSSCQLCALDCFYTYLKRIDAILEKRWFMHLVRIFSFISGVGFKRK